ncbi:TIR-like domain-containing protein (DUF1863) [Pseudomonas sp. GM49]|uniref:toll/interleukin-1 receptor domain-containing protein n=1 Tax=Pseudomonas sp. GM49 TaxID=1144331 RepID=UPI00027079DD|nr:toll/interleukin-1 receptor domain-containing protein [Pseudomonas sp. GM49]EJM69330.1 TIR-like domain-containing protein (DUF1863) [Pseudomonas sp. GM49]
MKHDIFSKKKEMAATHYVAFLSYAHVDEAIAGWLHKRLESYVVPASLVGREGRHGPIGKRLGRVFRDRTDLPASGSLAREICNALEVADFLIVLCSPNSAGSSHVMEEIRFFKALGKSHRILAGIVAGEPYATTKSGGVPEAECFPNALLNRVNTEGVISSTAEATEPLAADFREGKDGREAAVMKLIAGLLGLNLDELIQREKQAERNRRLRANTIAAVMTFLALGAFAAGGAAIWQSYKAEEQRQLAVARSLSVMAQALAKEDGAAQRDVLAALVVEAIKRLPPAEGTSLAAIMAVRLGEDIALDTERGEDLEVRFIPGKDEIAATGFAMGLFLLSMPDVKVRKVESIQLGSTDSGAPLSNFGPIDPRGRYLVVESHAGTSYVVDTDLLAVHAIPAESWSSRFSDDSAFVGSVTSDGYRSRFARFLLPGLEQDGFVIGEGGIYDLQYFDANIAMFFSEGRPLIVRSAAKQQAFAGDGKWHIKAVASDGQKIYLAMEDGDMGIPLPPPLEDDGTGSLSSQNSKATVASSEEKHQGEATRFTRPQGEAAGIYRLNWESNALESVLEIPAPLSVQRSSDKARLLIRAKDRVCWRQLGAGDFTCVPLQDADEQCSSVDCIALASNNRWLAAQIKSGWQLVDMQGMDRWSIAQESPKAALFSPTSRIALLLGDNDLVLIDLESHEVVARLPRTIDTQRVALNDKGNLLAFGGAGSVRVARLEPNALMAQLCKQPGRNLDEVQWKSYLGDLAWSPSCEGWK